MDNSEKLSLFRKGESDSSGFTDVTKGIRVIEEGVENIFSSAIIGQQDFGHSALKPFHCGAFEVADCGVYVLCKRYWLYCRRDRPTIRGTGFIVEEIAQQHDILDQINK